eukprot:s2619_g1.t1
MVIGFGTQDVIEQGAICQAFFGDVRPRAISVLIFPWRLARASRSLGIRVEKKNRMVQMISSNGPFSAEIFHVKICGSKGVSSTASRHFIGIAADQQEKDSAKVDDTSGHDMKFLLGCSAGPENLQRNDRESISTRFWQDLEEISSARLLVDAMAPESGFWVKSASFDFVDVSQTRQEKLPNLLEWVEPSCRQQVHIWDHVNACYCGRDFVRELPAVKFFCPGAESGLLLGRLSAKMQSAAPGSGGGGGDSDSSESEEDLNMQLLIEIKDLRKF